MITDLGRFRQEIFETHLTFDPNPQSVEMASKNVQRVKDSLESWKDRIEDSINEIDRICQEEADSLTPEQFAALKEKRRSLVENYETILRSVEGIHSRLNILSALLIEFSSLTSSMQSWMTDRTRLGGDIRHKSADPNILAQARIEAKSLLDEVLREESRLKTIGSSVIRIENEIEAMCDDVRESSSSIPTGISIHEVHETKRRVEDDYLQLVRQCQELLQFQNRVYAMNDEHAEQARRADEWLSELNQEVENVERAKVSDDEKLSRIEELNRMAAGGSAQLDEADSASRKLIDALEGTSAVEDVRLRHQKLADERRDRHRSVLDRLQYNMNEAASRKAEAEGLKTAVSNMIAWTNEVVEKLKHPVELPLNEIMLNEVKRDEHVLHGEIESRIVLAEELENKAKQLEDEELVNYLEECSKKLKRSNSDLKGLRDNIFDALNGLHLINSSGEKLARGIDSSTIKIRSVNPKDTAKMREIEEDIGVLKQNLAELEVSTKGVFNIPNVSQTEPISEKMVDLRKRIENCDEELSVKIGKMAELETLEGRFEETKMRTNDCLNALEKDLNALDKISVNKAKLIEQRKETADFAEKHAGAQKNIDELEGIAQQMDSLHAVRQVAETSGKVERLGNELKSRAEKINRNDHKVTAFEEAELAALEWMAKREEALDDIVVPTNKEEVKKVFMELERMDKAGRGEQRRVEEARLSARELAREASIESEINEMQEREKHLADAWESLADHFDHARNRVRDAEKLIDECEQIEKWLGAKRKMVDMIGAPSIDAGVARAQNGQVQLMKSDAENEKSNLDRANALANELIGAANDENAKILMENMDRLNRKWVSLESDLDDKASKIEEAAKLGQEVKTIINKLKKDLGELESNVENASAMSPNDIGEQLATLDSLKSRFGGVDEAIDRLKGILEMADELEVDATNRGEILEHLESTQKKADELERKIDNVKKAALNAQNEGVELGQKLDQLIGVVKSAENELDQATPICADATKLDDDAKRAEEIYRKLVSNEGDVSLLKAKVAEELKKKPNSDMKKKMEDLGEKWGKVMVGTRERRDRIGKVGDLVKQFCEAESALEQRLKGDGEELDSLLTCEENNSPEVCDALKLVEMTMGRRFADVDALGALMDRIENSAPGPDANRLRRKVEKLGDDCKAMAKKARTSAAQAQRKHDFLVKFEKLVDEVEQFAVSQKAKVEDAIAKDMMGNERVQSKFSEIEDFWSLKDRELKSVIEEIKKTENPDDLLKVDAKVESLQTLIDELFDLLKNQKVHLDEKKEAAEHIQGETQNASRRINSLISEISDLDPIGRSGEELNRQRSEIENLVAQLDAAEGKLIEINAEWEAAADAGIVSKPALEMNKVTVDELNKLAARARKRLAQREKKLNEIEEEIDGLQKNADEIVDSLRIVGDSEVLASTSSPAEPKVVAKKVKQLKESLKPIGEKIDGFVSDCKLLIKTAGPEADTAELDGLLNKVGDAWSMVAEKVADKEMTVDAAVQQQGKVDDAYRALLNWLEETEEMMENQKKPSMDAKVSKAQLHAYEVLMKHVEDKQTSVDGFAAMIGRINNGSEEEKGKLNEKNNLLQARYKNLLETARDRQRCLLDAVDLAERMQEVTIPLENWLVGAEKRLQALSKVPITVERANEMLMDRQELEDELAAKCDDLRDVFEIAPLLSGLVSVDDANTISGYVQELDQRTKALDTGISKMEPLLNVLLQQIEDFTLDAEDMAKFIGETEEKLNDFKELTIAPDDLTEHTNILADIGADIADRNEMIANILNVGKQLALQGEPEQSLIAQKELDDLKERYGKLVATTEEKISFVAKAFPLSERFHNSFEEVMSLLEEFEQDLERIDEEDAETQAEFIFALEEDIAKLRPRADELTALSTQLQALCSPDKADELLQNTIEMNKMMNSVADRVLRKAERIELHNKQSRAVYDDLAYLVDWFTMVRDRIVVGATPSLDPEFLKYQLKQQRVVNEDAAANKVQFRNVHVEAKKVARQLGVEGTEANAKLSEKVEFAKDLVDEVMNICADRTEMLERGLALAEELSDKFDELNDWLDEAEGEIQNSASVTTATPANELKAMHQHNTDLSQIVAAYRPIVEGFKTNVSALQEICSEDQAQLLENVSGELIARYEDVKEAVRARGHAIDNMMDTTIGFGERLETLVANLQGAADRLKENEGISADPSILESRLAENSSIIESLQDKQNAYDALKQSASQILANAPFGDTAAGDVENKLNRLDKLWKEIEKEAQDRGIVLEDVLDKSKQFWSELDACQKAVDDLKSRLDLVEPATGHPEQLNDQQQMMAQVASEMERTKPRIEALSIAGQKLANYVPDEEKAVIDSQVANVHGGFSTITALFAEKNRDLIAAMEKAMSFHGDLNSLLDWLDLAERRLAEMSPVEAAKQINEIGRELEDLHRFKEEVDERGVSKERVVATALQLAADAPPHLAATVRHPIAELNGRWGRLYAALAEREHKLESSLLQMGKLADAIAQLTLWMDKTKATLLEIALPRNAINLRDVEIAQCKLAVINNDVHAHQQSVDTVNQAAAQFAKTGIDQDTVEQLNEMNVKWEDINRILKTLASDIGIAKKEAENVGGEVEKWQGWLEDTEAQLLNTKPTGGLPETAEMQLDEFRVLKADVEQNQSALENYLDSTRLYLEDEKEENSWLANTYGGLKNKWNKVKELLVDREKKLQLAYQTAVELEQALNDMENWIMDAERRLTDVAPISRLPEVIAKQLEEHESWMEEVASRKAQMSQHHAAGLRMQYYCEKKDAIPIKNRLVSLKHRCEKVASRTADRGKQLVTTRDEVAAWQDGVRELDIFIADVVEKIDVDAGNATSSLEKLKSRLEDVKDAQKEVTAKQPTFDVTRKRGSALAERATRSEYKTIAMENEKLTKRWNEMVKKVRDRLKEAEQAVLEGGAFEEAMNDLESWVDDELDRYRKTDNDKVYGDIDGVRGLRDEENRRSAERKTKENGVKTVVKKADALIASGVDERAAIREAKDRLIGKWNEIEEAARVRAESIKEAEKAAEEFDAKTHALLDWLAVEEQKLKAPVKDVKASIGEINKVKTEMNEAKQNYKQCLAKGAEILENCNPQSEPTLRNWMRVVEARWKEVSEKVDEREFALLEEEQKEKERDELIARLVAFAAKKREELNRMIEKPLAQDLEAMSEQLGEMDELDAALREKQPEIDEACKVAKKGGRKSAAGEMLSNEWNKIWLDTMGLRSTLDAQKALLNEMKRLEGWKWEDWKERYVEWNDHAKARVSDLFRRIDRLHTGNVPRNVFIDGIIGSKFPTSRLEMEKVADVFDKGDGMINAKEFINALRFDSTQRNLKPQTDTEKITHEIERQKKTCSCCQPYQIEKISDNHYRFGDTHIKRMVRILRSTVMVRVGGGWESLDEFLHKHDPCRAKGRLNINMFPEAKPTNALDSMRAFTKNRHAKTPPSSGTPGPIMKIREKTDRSVPMSGGLGGTAGYTPISAVTTSRIPRASSDLSAGRLSRVGSQSNSRSSVMDSSQAPSRPSSRASSDAGDKQSRIPSLRSKKGTRYNPSK